MPAWHQLDRARNANSGLPVWLRHAIESAVAIEKIHGGLVDGRCICGAFGLLDERLHDAGAVHDSERCRSAWRRLVLDAACMCVLRNVRIRTSNQGISVYARKYSGGSARGLFYRPTRDSCENIENQLHITALRGIGFIKPLQPCQASMDFFGSPNGLMHERSSPLPFVRHPVASAH